MVTGTFTVSTSTHMELVDITDQFRNVVRQSGIRDGICFGYNPHTTAGLTINEGCDPAVRHDLVGVFKKIVPRDFPYQHLEGNSPSHMMATLTGSSIQVFIEGGELLLGTWQRIFFCEFDGPRTRKVRWKILEDRA